MIRLDKLDPDTLDWVRARMKEIKHLLSGRAALIADYEMRVLLAEEIHIEDLRGLTAKEEEMANEVIAAAALPMTAAELIAEVGREA